MFSTFLLYCPTKNTQDTNSNVSEPNYFFPKKSLISQKGPTLSTTIVYTLVAESALAFPARDIFWFIQIFLGKL